MIEYEVDHYEIITEDGKTSIFFTEESAEAFARHNIDKCPRFRKILNGIYVDE